MWLDGVFIEGTTTHRANNKWTKQQGHAITDSNQIKTKVTNAHT